MQELIELEATERIGAALSGLSALQNVTPHSFRPVGTENDEFYDAEAAKINSAILSRQ